MTYNESTKYYQSKYKRYKQSSNDFEGILLEYKESSSEELKTTLKSILWFNVARLSLDIVYSLFYGKLNKLDDVIDDFVQQAYISFNKSLKYYDINSGIKFSSYFISNWKKDAYEYYNRYYTKPNITLPSMAKHYISNGKYGEDTKKSFDELNIGYIEDYKRDDSETNMLDKYMVQPSSELNNEPGLQLFQEKIKPLILKRLKRKDTYKFVEMFEKYYFPTDEKITYQIISNEYGVSKEAVRNSIDKVLNIIKYLVNKNDDVKDFLLKILK